MTTFKHKIRSSYSNLVDAGLSLLYPRACGVCREIVERHADGVACAGCWAQTTLFAEHDAMCWKCGTPALGAVGELNAAQREKMRCHACDNEAWTAARAIGKYESALRVAVLNLKREPFVSPRLAELLRERQLFAPLNAATLIISVPLHPKRERERGFNQALVIAQTLAKRSGLPLDGASLVRTSYAEVYRRAGMDAIARRATVENAFEVQRPRLVRNQSVLLIDDVFTTGATVGACSAALLAAGAREVFVLTIARA